MTFYVRHVAELLRRAGAEPTPQNRELLDRAIREALGMERADANTVWDKVKEIMFSGKDNEKKRNFEEEVVRKMIKYLITG